MRPRIERLALFIGVIAIGLFFGSAPASAAEAREQVGAQIDRPPAEALLGGTVTYSDGSPAVGLVVDFFAANPDGSRETFLGDVETDGSGVFSRSVAPGCYVLTYIAPKGDFFFGGGRYFQVGLCVDAGEKVTDLDAQLEASSKKEGSVGGTVRFSDGPPVVGLIVDFFEANADGSRGTFLGDEATGNDGTFRRIVNPGCYVLVFIAPQGQSLVGGGQYFEVPICVAAGESATVNAALIGRGAGCFIGGKLVKTALIHDECDALLTLYNTTDGPNWVINTGWSTPTDPCTWHGLTCRDFQLRAVELPANGLVGAIPSDLAALINLDRLILAANLLSGPIPPELGQLTNLTQLNLSADQLSGPIPPELGQLTKLTRLELNQNGLSGPIPSELGQLTDLKVLWLFRTGLSGPIPPELGQLTNLTDLALYQSGFSGPIPPELGGLVNLAGLALFDNDLSGPIPTELGQLTNLEALTLFDNDLSGPIPAELGQLTNLTRLFLGDNQLSGPIPEVLGQLDDLVILELSGNQLSGPIPAELGQLTNLRRLDLSANQLAGPIPPDLGQLINLADLDLSANQLTGDITSAMTGIRLAGTIRNLQLGDGPGGNDCFTVTDANLADWLTSFDPTWDECD